MQKATHVQPHELITPPYQYDPCMKQVAMVTARGTPSPSPPRGTSSDSLVLI